MKPKLDKHSRLAAVSKLLSGVLAKQVCAEFGISRALLYRLRKRYLEANKNPASLKVKSRRALSFGHPKLTPEDRLNLIKEVLEKDKSVCALCKKYGISRTVFYRLLARYHQAKSETKEGQGSGAEKAALEDRPPIPHRFPK